MRKDRIIDLSAVAAAVVRLLRGLRADGQTNTRASAVVVSLKEKARGLSEHEGKLKTIATNIIKSLVNRGQEGGLFYHSQIPLEVGEIQPHFMICCPMAKC